MTILDLLSRDNFLMTNIKIAKALGLNNAVLIGELARKWNYWTINNGLTDDGYFFITQQEIEDDTTLSKYQQNVCFKQLMELGIISIEQKGGTQRTNYYRINEQELANYLDFHSQKTLLSISEKLDYGKSKNSTFITNTKNTNTAITKTVYEIVEYLNRITGSRYKANTPTTVKLIRARLKEGYTADDFKYVIDLKYKEWKDSDMAQYLRPQTLFGNKFESYLNQKPKQSEYERFMAGLQEMYDEEMRNGK